MSHAIEKRIVLTFYQTFMRGFLEDPSFKINTSSNEDSVIDKFISLVEEEYQSSAGVSFLYDYFSLQINYWDDKGTFLGKKIPIAWMIGEKAFDRWLKSSKQSWWHHHQTSEKYGLSIDMFQVQEPIDHRRVYPHEEIEKKRFHNTRMGLSNCIENTTLYNAESQSCSSCKYIKSCIGIMKKNYYRLYLKRINNEKNTDEKR